MFFKALYMKEIQSFRFVPFISELCVMDCGSGHGRSASNGQILIHFALGAKLLQFQHSRADWQNPTIDQNPARQGPLCSWKNAEKQAMCTTFSSIVQGFPSSPFQVYQLPACPYQDMVAILTP